MKKTLNREFAKNQMTMKNNNVHMSMEQVCDGSLMEVGRNSKATDSKELIRNQLAVNWMR